MHTTSDHTNIVKQRKMIVCVRFFASCREIVGISELLLELDPDSNTDNLIAALVVRFPRLNDSIQQVSIAVNKKYIESSQSLKDGDEIALLPPMSGG